MRFLHPAFLEGKVFETFAVVFKNARRLHTNCFLRPKLKSYRIQYRTVHNLSLKDDGVQKYLEELHSRLDEIQRRNPNLYQVVHKIEEKLSEQEELEELSKANEELRDIAKADAVRIVEELQDLEKQFFDNVLEPEPYDHNDVALEVSAGVGGQEAMLFAKDLFAMYENFARHHGCEFQITACDVTDIGGVRQASAQVSGLGAFRRLKYECGVHRVQRVPKTEKSGRIHTSTATVAVLPVPTEIQVIIRPQDLKYEAKKASGAGGQHVNTTESAIRLTHIPTGVVVECQTDRSQIRNKEIALQMLRTKIYEKEYEKQTSQMQKTRKLQVGMGGRSEKIRTYNFVQDRVTDHRIGLTVYNLRGILEGREYLQQVVEELQKYDDKERLQQLFM